MNELRFATEKEALQYLADLLEQKVYIAGSKLGPGIPDGTGPNSETDECPFSKTSEEKEEEETKEEESSKEEEESSEGEEKYVKETQTSETRKVVIEREDDMFETEVYVLKDDKWKPKEAYYFDSMAQAEAKYNELLKG